MGEQAGGRKGAYASSAVCVAGGTQAAGWMVNGWWRHSARVGRERQGTEDCSDELTPRWMEEWSYRPGLSAVMPGTVAGWLLGYARTNVEMRRSSRKQWAAWWVRMMGRDGEDWGGLYRDAVRQGKRPVKTGAEEMWDRWCGMNRGKELEVQGVQVRRHGQRVWIAGGDARMVRRVGGESGEASG